MREFQELQQTIETMAEITAKFREQALFIPQYALDEDMRRTGYHSIPRDNIHEVVSFLG